MPLFWRHPEKWNISFAVKVFLGTRSVEVPSEQEIQITPSQKVLRSIKFPEGTAVKTRGRIILVWPTFMWDEDFGFIRPTLGWKRRLKAEIDLPGSMRIEIKETKTRHTSQEGLTRATIKFKK